MSVRLYLRDKVNGQVHEYGTDPNDSLVLTEDGDLAYCNLKTHETSGKFGGYEFRQELWWRHEYDIGGNQEGVDCWRCKYRKKVNVCEKCSRFSGRRQDWYRCDEGAEKGWEALVKEEQDVIIQSLKEQQERDAEEEQEREAMAEYWRMQREDEEI